MNACRQLSAEETQSLKVLVSDAKKAKLKKNREPRFTALDHLDDASSKPEQRFAKGRKKRPLEQPTEFTIAEIAAAQRHPSFQRVVRACCPLSGLSRSELEQHVTGILKMIDEADGRTRYE